MKTNESFSLRARGKSFKYAFNGVKRFFKSEHNALLHLLGTLIVIVMAVITHVSRSEIIFLTLVTGFVWLAELFNTAIEKIMDLITVKQDHRIRYIKDVSAAAVLVSAVMAFITGCIVFIPKLVR